MSKIHLIMPMAGGGSRFLQEGFKMPKPLIELCGKPFFYWATQSIVRDIHCVDVTFVVLEQHVKQWQIDAAIKKFFPDAKILTIPEVLPGAVCTCLKGIENINDNIPVIFNDCDHMFSCKALANRLSNTQPIDFDGALITFESSAAQFSYVKYDTSGNIIGTVEKQVVSNRAICGAYFFANAELFRTISERYFETCQYKEYFVSGLYNELCKANKKVLAFAADFYLPFGTPSEYERAKNSSRFL
ncbi:MAG: hypothetical protein IKD73_05105 [Selenomonadaceae bacterium]|nr:hypothetical protein [Selenomonadaceae bacterium]